MVIRFLAQDLNATTDAGSRTFDSMQSLALNPDAWRLYVNLRPGKRRILREALLYPFEVTIGNILRYPNLGVVVTSNPPVPPLPAGPAAPVVPFIRPRPTINNHNIGEFRTWVDEVSEIASNHPSVTFGIPPFRLLPNDNGRSVKTYATTIQIRLNGNPVVGASFVAHYHPKTQSSSVGNHGASNFHLKPTDGNPIVRIVKEDIPAILGNQLRPMIRGLR